MSNNTTGLDGVVVAQTQLCHIDGQKGQLIIKGHSIESIANHYSFEQAASLLWHDLSNLEETPELIQQGLAQARQFCFQELSPFFQFGASLPLIEGLRMGLSRLSDTNKLPHHYLTTAAIAVLIPALLRIKKQLKPIAPNPAFDHVADFLTMLKGIFTQEEHRALTTYLVSVSEHSLNASTFTARVIASTQAGIISSVIGALCALKGPLHGGAPGPVLDMLDAIGTSDNIESWLHNELLSGKRLMGFGHRVYKVRDPRANVLKEAVSLLQQSSHHPRLELAEKVELAAIKILKQHKPDRLLQTNVEFYTALLLETLGIPRGAFTAIFSTGRVLGWTAHIMEQTQTGRLMRPRAEYIGTMD